MNERIQTWLRVSAIGGAVLWEIGFFKQNSTIPETELINKILLLGVLVIVPLGLAAASRGRAEQNSLSFRAAAYAQPFGALAVVVSFLLQQGTAAAALAVVWLAVTGLIALHGLLRLFDRERRTFPEVVISAGFVFLSVGGGWLVMSRLGAQPLGFGDTIVLLTAVHFHFAGFAAPILTGLAGRSLAVDTLRVSPLVLIVGCCVIAGTPLVAAGITLSPAVGLGGTLVISIGLLLLAVIVIGRVVPKLQQRSVQLLLIVSSVSPFVSMTLAAAYAYSIVAKKLIIDIPQMALAHGMVNAFGFALCGLLAWSILRSD